MTLVAGTITWNGVLMCTDTRATHKHNDGTYSYTDDILKIDMLPAGLGIGVAGDCRTATVFREILNNRFRENEEQSDSFDGPAQIIKSIIEDSLRDLANDSEISEKDPNETEISGLISSIDTGIRMRLSSENCKKIMEIQSKNNYQNSVWNKYKDVFKKCADGLVDVIELPEYHRSLLFSFRSRLAVGMGGGVLDVEIVPFGKIAVCGSGRSEDHEEQQINTLSYALFGTEADQIEDSALHILRTHGWSERVKTIDEKYGFRTFGGGYLAGAFFQSRENPERVVFGVSTRDIFRDKNHTNLVCSVYQTGNDLCVKTGDGEDLILTKFWEYKNKSESCLYL